MKILLSWLQDFFSEKLNAQMVVDALYRVGIEVEHVEETGKGLDGVIVARIDEAKPHPNADKLTLCKVSDGKQTLDIVCGAKNFKVGDHVALATIGTKLPNGMEIQKSKIRGEVSFGMLCSADELGFAKASEGIVILENTTTLGQPLKETLNLEDAVLHLALTPNRGDCYSILGVAIELAASLNLKIKPPIKSLSTFQAIPISVEVTDSQACSKYTLHRIEGVAVKPSPNLISQRLEKCGVRPVNNIVDVTNYYMLERGQPMHAFDADCVNGKIQVRKAKQGEKITCLDEETRELTTDDLIIADETGPIGIAGVMGGLNSSITEKTKNVFLETAMFDPKSIRTTSRRLNLISESSKRFEREIDPSSVLPVAMVAAGMIEENSGGKIIGGVDIDHLKKMKTNKIHVTHANIKRILGVEIPNAGECLSRLGFSLEKMDTGWMVEVPHRRPEIQREIDLIEEIARIYGYDNIPSQLPNLHIEPKVDSTFARMELLRQKITGVGMQEVVTYSFTSPAWSKIFVENSPIEVENPLTPDASRMRTFILPGLLDTWKMNHSRQCDGVRLFEIGKTYFMQGKNIKETLKLAALWAGNIDSKFWYRQKGRVASFYDGKGFLEVLFAQYRIPAMFVAEDVPSFLHPGQSIRIMIAKKIVGFLGILHPTVSREMDIPGPVCVLELELPLLLEMANRKPKFDMYSAYPKVERDLALVIKKDIPYGDVMSEIKSLNIPFMTSAVIFDRFEGGSIPKGSISLAYRFVFQSHEKTLTDTDVEQALDRISEHLKAKFEASVRS